jgi:hypothetical protein
LSIEAYLRAGPAACEARNRTIGVWDDERNVRAIRESKLYTRPR